ncbi:MAG: hypothetical protein JNM99_06055 [Verrucomicrobiaceae bacterium]|nr:hypothetical protein [Verrucomicrobiaceae bacterium]
MRKIYKTVILFVIIAISAAAALHPELLQTLGISKEWRSGQTTANNIVPSAPGTSSEANGGRTSTEGTASSVNPVLATLATAFSIFAFLYQCHSMVANSKKKKRKQATESPEANPKPRESGVELVLKVGTWSLSAALLAYLFLQVQWTAASVSDLTNAVLPDGRAQNIQSLEKRIRDLETSVRVNAESRWILVWYNHFESNMLYQVNRTDMGKNEVRNDEFRTWCSLFNEQDYIIQERYLVAADEQFKDVPGKGKENWWTTPEYNNLPRLKPRWLQIMDDERWYVYKVIPRGQTAAH